MTHTLYYVTYIALCHIHCIIVLQCGSQIQSTIKCKHFLQFNRSTTFCVSNVPSSLHPPLFRDSLPNTIFHALSMFTVSLHMLFSLEPETLFCHLTAPSNIYISFSTLLLSRSFLQCAPSTLHISIHITKAIFVLEVVGDAYGKELALLTRCRMKT